MPQPHNANNRHAHLSRHCPAAISSLVLAAVLVLGACGKKGDAPMGAGAGPRAPEVGVVAVKPGDIGLVTELPGRLEASRIAEVRARAAGSAARGLPAHVRAVVGLSLRTHARMTASLPYGLTRDLLTA